MAEASLNTEMEKDGKQLLDIFMEGWKLAENLEVTDLDSNSTAHHDLVKRAMENLEQATVLVSEIGMFSSNELIDEVSTESLRYMLLPHLLGKLAMKLGQRDRSDVLNVAEIYFKDYLQRCEEYELCEYSSKSITNTNSRALNELEELMQAANARNSKIAKFRLKKELEEQVKAMETAVSNNLVDDEVKRDYYMKLLRKSIIDANEELDSIKLERQVLKLQKVDMSSGSSIEAGSSFNPKKMHPQGHAHSHSHWHNQMYRPKPKPLKPFIITRNDTQKAVFGLGYPSVPVMTVDEFYTQRVHEGIFPDEEKSAKINAEQALAASRDPNEQEDEEKAVIDEQIETDDPEYLARMRRMDEYKDNVRRGDGNRHNRS